VLNGAQSVVKQYDPDRLDKLVLEFESLSDAKIVIHNVPSEKKEAELISIMARSVLPSHDVLVLVPHRGFAGPIKQSMRKFRNGYHSRAITEGVGWNLLNIVKIWLDNEHDNFALRECIQAIIDGGALGVPSRRARSDKNRQERERRLRTISLLWKRVIDGEKSLFDALNDVASEDGLVSQVARILKEIQEAKNQAPEEFLRLVVSRLHPWSNVDRLLAEVHDWIEEWQGLGMSSAEGVARLMTPQSAKGLEADFVFVIGLEEGVFARLDLTDAQLRETSRLLYVCMTRARKELHLFHARSRPAGITFLAPTGGQRYQLLQRSRFLGAIPDEHIETKYYRSGRGSGTKTVKEA
jgi:superfamily I DNA/RNA helicase